MTTPPEAAPPPTAVARWLYLAAGVGFVGVAYVGVLVPGLPATPWALAASYCFGRSSPRLQRWLWRAPFFGRLLSDWHAHGGMRPATKRSAVVMVAAACSASAALAPVPAWVRVAIAAAGLTGVGVILFVVPTAGVGGSNRQGGGGREPPDRSTTA